MWAGGPLATGADGGAISQLVPAAGPAKSELFNNMEVTPLHTRVTTGRGARTGAARQQSVRGAAIVTS